MPGIIDEPLIPTLISDSAPSPQSEAIADPGLAIASLPQTLIELAKRPTGANRQPTLSLESSAASPIADPGPVPAEFQLTAPQLEASIATSLAPEPPVTEAPKHDLAAFTRILADSAAKPSAAAEQRPGAEGSIATDTTLAVTDAQRERASDILRQVRLHLSPELRQATIQLAPAELGRISIRISLREGRLYGIVHAERAETLDALERHLPELRASLARHGIEPESFQMSLGQHGRSNEHRSTSGSRGDRAGFPAWDASSPVPAVPAPIHRLLAREDGVDTYA